jgi:hypothetical protein
MRSRRGPPAQRPRRRARPRVSSTCNTPGGGRKPAAAQLPRGPRRGAHLATASRLVYVARECRRRAPRAPRPKPRPRRRSGPRHHTNHGGRDARAAVEVVENRDRSRVKLIAGRHLRLGAARAAKRYHGAAKNWSRVRSHVARSQRGLQCDRIWIRP